MSPEIILFLMIALPCLANLILFVYIVIGKTIWFNKSLAEDLIKLYKWLNDDDPPDDNLNVKILKYIKIPEIYSMPTRGAVSSADEVWGIVHGFHKGQDEHGRQRLLNLEIELRIYRRWANILVWIGILTVSLNLYLANFLYNNGECLREAVKNL